MPTVSVIIPVYNAGLYVAEAIKSVIAQSHKPLEIIVVDDGSTDSSAEVIKRFHGIHYFYKRNSGISDTRNLGVKHARGDYFSFLDADDVWVGHKLELQLAAFEANPDLDIVFGHVKQFFSPELKKEQADGPSSPDAPQPGFIPSTMTVKRNAFFKVGLFESRWKMGEFASWYLRSLELGLRHHMLPNVVTWRRVHGANNGILHRESIKDYIHIIKASLDRRRAAGDEPDKEQHAKNF